MRGTFAALAACLMASAASACSGGGCEEGENRICMRGECLCGKICDSDGDCLPNQICATNISDESACISRVFESGNAPDCESGQTATEALCGGDRCSCADPCSVNEDCRSLCCIEGVCALPCVCEGTSVEVIQCAGT